MSRRPSHLCWISARLLIKSSIRFLHCFPTLSCCPKSTSTSEQRTWYLLRSVHFFILGPVIPVIDGWDCVHNKPSFPYLQFKWYGVLLFDHTLIVSSTGSHHFFLLACMFRLEGYLTIYCRTTQNGKMFCIAKQGHSHLCILRGRQNCSKCSDGVQLGHQIDCL